MRLAATRQPTLDALLAEAARDLDLAAGVEAADDAPLWTPLPLEPGRGGILLPDGRRLSPQQAAVESPADELFFGGNLGGGKSDLLLGLALTQHTNSIVFRQQFTQLRGAEGLFERSRTLIGLRGVSNAGLYSWKDLPGGRNLEFGAARTLDDARHWMGRPHDFIGFDEGTEFLEAVYRLLIAWLRTTKAGQRTRVVLTSNPPLTEEGRWVIRYWAPWLEKTHPRPAQPGELRWFVVDDGKSREVDGPASGTERPAAVQVRTTTGLAWVRPRSRSFIPSSVQDNPYYMRTGYADVLDALPAELQALRTGDFAADVAADPWQIIPTLWVKAAQARWTPEGGDGVPLSAIGVDPSRGGQDEFVVAPRHGAWLAPLIAVAGKEVPDGPTGARHVVAALNGDDPAAVPIQVDSGGVGAAVVDALRAESLPQVVALNGAEKSHARDKSGRYGFVNKRAEWYWKMREALDPASGQDLALPPDPQLRADLCATKWELATRGIQAEDKAAVQKRIGRSPDRGEAVIYACVQPTRVPVELLFQEADVETLAGRVAALKAQLGLGNGKGTGNGSAGNGHG